MAALEEPAAETFLEMADLMADRRRRQVELGGRAGEAQMPRRRLEGAQRMQRRQTGHSASLADQRSRNEINLTRGADRRLVHRVADMRFEFLEVAFEALGDFAGHVVI